MNRFTAKDIRVLAIDPITRGFGFAVLEGPRTLIDWGTRAARQDKHARCLKLVQDLIERYEPSVIVVEKLDGKGSRRCMRVRRLIGSVLILAAKRGVRTRSYSPLRVRRTFFDSGPATKHDVAKAVADRLPELAPRLPPPRKIFMSADDRMAIFDAAALALTFFDENRATR